MAVSARDGEDATGDGAEKRETGEDRLAGGKEIKERKSGGKSPLAFACRTDGRTYGRLRICAGTDGGETYRRSTLSLNGRKKVAEVDGGALRWWTETAE